MLYRRETRLQSFFTLELHTASLTSLSNLLLTSSGKENSNANIYKESSPENHHVKIHHYSFFGRQSAFRARRKQPMRSATPRPRPPGNWEHFGWTYSTSILLVSKFFSKQFNKILAAYIVRVELIKGKNLKGAQNVQQIVPYPAIKHYMESQPINGQMSY